MKTLKLSSVVVAAMLLFTTACKRDNNKSGVIYAANNAHEFVNVFGPKTQKVVVDVASLPKTITLEGGTKITIPAGALKVGGVAVTGNVIVEVIEVLKRSAVLFGGSNTNHISGAPLASDGFIYVNIKANDIYVDSPLSEPLQIAIPAKRTGATQLWEGVNANGVPLVQGAANQMAWAAQKAPANGQGGGRETVPVGGFYNFSWGTTGWINCDVFYSYSNPKTTITVTLVNNPGTLASFHSYSGETYVFFCAKGSNVAAQLYTPNGPNSVKSYDNMMPIGVEGKLLSFCIKDGKYYYAEQIITIAANQALTLTLAEVTEAQVQTAISSLDSY